MYIYSYFVTPCQTGYIPVTITCLLPCPLTVLLFSDACTFGIHIPVSLHSVWAGASAFSETLAFAEICFLFFNLTVSLLQDSSKSPRPMKKFLPGNRKKERKASDDEIQIRKSMNFNF